MSSTTIRTVRVATVRGQLPQPIQFGEWIMRHREFAVVRVDLADGTVGWSFTLTRDGAVAEQIRRSLAAEYVGKDAADPVSLFDTAQARSFGSYSAGVGLRALSLLDLATWDAIARHGQQPIATFLGGAAARMPSTSIAGYPPAAMGPTQVFEQVTELSEQGWTRFKLPVAASMPETIARLEAARNAAPEAWLGCDAAWIFRRVADAEKLARACRDLGLSWLEDIFPPGDVSSLVALRDRVDLPIAMGDEQGGSYYPQSLIDCRAVDVIRIDLTCMGGISGGRRIVDQCSRAGVEFAPHMFAHVHSQVFSGWGFVDVPIEWGAPWTGVDPYADSLGGPELKGDDGRMEPLGSDMGFGKLVDLDWIRTQPHDDPDGLFANC